jgi:plasmid stability protein
MASITIRNLPNATKENLRVKAAQCGLSLEQYLRNILQKASVEEHVNEPKVMEEAAKYFGSKNGIDLTLPRRNSTRDKVEF